jgi:hypothetical protein
MKSLLFSVTVGKHPPALLDAAARGLQHDRLVAALRECRDYFAEEGFDKYSPGAHPMTDLFHAADNALRPYKETTDG